MMTEGPGIGALTPVQTPQSESLAVNVASLLVETARSHPDRAALEFEGETYTYRELERLTSRFAHALEALGVRSCEVVAIFLESRPELLIAYLGAMRAGVVPNVVNAFLQTEEVCNIVADSEAKVLVTDSARLESLTASRNRLGVETIVVLDGASHEDRGWTDLLDRQPDRHDLREMPSEILASLLYTSGTTGNPKGVMLSHRNILDNAEGFSRVHFIEGDRLLVAAPLFHCWGLISGVLGMFRVGGTALIVRRFQTEPVLDLIESARPTAMIGVATMYNYMNRSPSFDSRDISSVKFVLSAAAPTPLELIDALRNRWKVGYAESYGLTETSPVITTTHHTELRRGSCGRAMGDTKLKVVGSDGRTLEIGETGELWASGTAISQGYYKKGEATAAVFTRDGWFRTGDIATIDNGGYVYIVDRLKDMINVAGEKVYPRDVEEVLHRHPAVADAVVIGVPDADRGEVVKAYVVRRASTDCSEEDLLEHLRPVLAAFKLPRSIEFLDTIPRSPSGKALRRLLRGG
jgi:long-chain acyl-CoA synthetase